MPTADNPRAGQFTLGIYAWYQPQIAGPFFLNQPDQTRYFAHYGGDVSAGTRPDQLVVGLRGSGGGQVTAERRRLAARDSTESPDRRPVQRVTKARRSASARSSTSTPRPIPTSASAVWLAGHIPVGPRPRRTAVAEHDRGRSTRRRADWEWGGAISKSWFTGMVSYTLRLAERADADHDDPRRPTICGSASGPTSRSAPRCTVIIEIAYNVYDGGDFPQHDYAELNAGARFWFGHSGWAVHGALGTNLSMLFNHGTAPNPFGGILGVTYAAWPPAPPPPVVVPAPEPVVEAPPPAPAPARRPRRRPRGRRPARPPTRSSSTARSARLTNIAKAVLDGVALRMKNDLNATAVVTGYTDNTGSEQSNMELGARRAQAAKDYLVTRHGIDPGRITTASRGAADPAFDNATAEGRRRTAGPRLW